MMYGSIYDQAIPDKDMTITIKTFFRQGKKVFIVIVGTEYIHI